MSCDRIRNFCIIAHIDHGKSTLSDRIIEKTTQLQKKEIKEQILDSLEIERERGITVKSAAVSLSYSSSDQKNYNFNLIDTPGHVDFNYEVSRSLAACEGALLLVDATQGVRAQTLANFYLAFDSDLTIIPVINKIDLPAAEVELVRRQINQELGFDQDEMVLISAKSGLGVDQLLEKIVSLIPDPGQNKLYLEKGALKALIFDSFFDIYRGVVICIRIFSGSVKASERVKLFFTQREYVVEEVGIIQLKREKKEALFEGAVGYIILGIKSLSEIKIGDTITQAGRPCSQPCPGYQEVKPMVFAGVFPIDSHKYENLKTSMEKLKLNDSALQFEKENSVALGFGFRCGFLGLLHMEIFQERLLKEFDMPVLLTAPSVAYRVYLKSSNDWIEIDNPSKLPDPNLIERIEEPFIKATIITPSEFLGNVMKLVREKRGIQSNLVYLDQKRIEATYEMPLAEVILDFFDQLKSISKGYASLDYDLLDYRVSQITKVDILVNKEPLDALSFLVHREKAKARAGTTLSRLREEIPRHMFQIPLQAAIGSTIIARENISALRKDVTAKCYGGDITRKRKLLEKQKQGKKKMKSVGMVEIPQKAFINVLRDKHA